MNAPGNKKLPGEVDQLYLAFITLKNPVNVSLLVITCSPYSQPNSWPHTVKLEDIKSESSKPSNFGAITNQAFPSKSVTQDQPHGSVNINITNFDEITVWIIITQPTTL